MAENDIPDQVITDGLEMEQLAPSEYVEGAKQRVEQMKKLLQDAKSSSPQGQEIFDRARDIMPDYEAAIAGGELTVKDCVMLKRIAVMCLAVTLGETE